jgi:phosphoribosylformylglycinamidine cyclo-ligase
LETYRKQIHGIIHATGGGQTKCLKFAQNVHIIKDKLFPVPEVFRLIQASANTSWEEMYRTFNMGCRMEIYTEPTIADELIARARSVAIPAQIIGRVEASTETRLTIETEKGRFTYLV